MAKIKFDKLDNIGEEAAPITHADIQKQVDDTKNIKRAGRTKGSKYVEDPACHSFAVAFTAKQKEELQASATKLDRSMGSLIKNALKEKGYIS